MDLYYFWFFIIILFSWGFFFLVDYLIVYFFFLNILLFLGLLFILKNKKFICTEVIESRIHVCSQFESVIYNIKLITELIYFVRWCNVGSELNQNLKTLMDRLIGLRHIYSIEKNVKCYVYRFGQILYKLWLLRTYVKENVFFSREGVVVVVVGGVRGEDGWWWWLKVNFILFSIQWDLEFKNPTFYKYSIL